jgi:hypothetical protein
MRRPTLIGLRQLKGEHRMADNLAPIDDCDVVLTGLALAGAAVLVGGLLYAVFGGSSAPEPRRALPLPDRAPDVIRVEGLYYTRLR